MPTLYIMCGVGFAGKSTLAKQIAAHFNIPLVSQDGMYFEKREELKIDQDNDEQWRMLLDMCLQRLRDLLNKGQSVVFDDVNLRRVNRDELRELAKEVGARSVVVYLDTPKEILNERQKKNILSGERHQVKQEYLDEAKAQLEVPTADENVFVFSPDTDLDKFLEGLSR